MNTYTPTTKQIEEFWASDGAGQPAAKSYNYAEGLLEFRRWLAQHDRETAASAWDEGRECGTIDAMLQLSYGVIHQAWNPYKEEA